MIKCSHKTFYYEGRIKKELCDFMHDSIAFWSENGYTSNSPIPWIRGVSPDVEPHEWIFSMTQHDRPYAPDQDIELFNRKDELLEN